MTQHLPQNYIFRLLFPLLYGSIIYILILLVFENFNAVLESFFSREWLFTITLSYMSSEMLHLVSVILSKKLNFPANITRYIVIQLSATLIAEVILVLVSIHIYFTIFEGFSVYFTELVIFEVFYLFSALLFNLYIFSFLFLNQENTIQDELESEMIRKNEYSLQALRNDIDPDVFYSVMESLLIYLDKDEKACIDIVNRLSALYRYRLENKFTELIGLKYEKHALSNLLQLFNYIYSGSIIYTFENKPEEKKYQVPPVWLQKIILAIFKCNLISPIVKFNISIDCQKDILVLKHTGKEKLLVSEKDEIEKLSEEFKFFTNRKIEMRFDYEMVILAIPVLNSESVDENPFVENELLNETLK